MGNGHHRKRRSRSRRSGSRPLLKLAALLLLAVGCLAGGWYGMHVAFGGKQDKPTQVAQADPTTAAAMTPATKSESTKPTKSKTTSKPKPPTKTKPKPTKTMPKPPPKTTKTTKPKPKPPDPPKTTPVVYFDTHIKPIFDSKCIKCHGDGKFDGKFDARTVAAILKGGENGVALIPGNPEKSPMWFDFIKTGDMPPKREKNPLKEEEKLLIYNWIKGGAKVSATATKPPPSTNALVFEKDIFPIFQSKCIKCHGDGKFDGKFDARTVASILKGGESGPGVIPGNPEKSLMWFDFIKTGDMPPKREKQLTDEQKKKIYDWIKGGAKSMPNT